MKRHTMPSRQFWSATLVLAMLVFGVCADLPAAAAGPANSGAAIPPKVGTEEGVHWGELKPAQQAVLRPLEREWSRIDVSRKRKWLELSVRFPKMTPEEQSRVHARMAEWAKMTPQERGQARLNFQEAKQVPALDRQARWESYQALPAERKRQLAARAASSPGASQRDMEVSAKPAAPSGSGKTAPETAQAKSNIVPNPAFAAPPRPVAPTVVRASPGATTTLISKRPTPPSHQQTGLPKIAATPEFVDKTTLLPRRGPQAAATRSAKASEAEPPRRQ